ncbi:MAG: hypothetical protein RJA05_1540 [Planctomycetota bacterium]
MSETVAVRADGGRRSPRRNDSPENRHQDREAGLSGGTVPARMEEVSVTGDQLRESLRVFPFKPFRLHLADQRTVDVLHQEFALVFPSRRHVLVVQPGNEDRWQIIDVGLIVSIGPIEDQPGASQAA